MNLLDKKKDYDLILIIPSIFYGFLSAYLIINQIPNSITQCEDIECFGVAPAVIAYTFSYGLMLSIPIFFILKSLKIKIKLVIGIIGFLFFITLYIALLIQ